MKHVSYGTFKQRVAYAQMCILSGNDKLTASREMDNCFEMGDGGEVCAELTRRAYQNTKLWDAITMLFGGTYPAKWLEEEEKRRQPDLFEAMA